MKNPKQISLIVALLLSIFIVKNAHADITDICVNATYECIVDENPGNTEVIALYIGINYASATGEWLDCVTFTLSPGWTYISGSEIGTNSDADGNYITDTGNSVTFGSAGFCPGGGSTISSLGGPNNSFIFQVMAPPGWDSGDCNAEGVSWTSADYPAEAVDWILVSFRTDIQKNTEIGMTAALLLKDGTVQIPETFELPAGTNAAYIVIEHRNHIGVMTPEAIDIEGNTLTHDFTLADSYDGNGTGSGQKQLPTGEWVMFAGDADQSDLPSYDILGSDKILWEMDNGNFDYYSSPDFNMDGDVNGADKSIWFENNGISSRVPK